MAILLSDNLQIGVGAPIDNKYLNASNVPYSSTAEVINRINLPQRYQGLTVNILGVEYWFENGVADTDLVIKGTGGAASGERIQRTFTQSSHGFLAGDVVAYSGTTFVKAIADGSQNNIEVFGIVTDVPTVNEFTVVFAGYIDGLTPLGLNPNTTYYLSTSVAGEITSSDATIFGNVSKPILTTLTDDDALVFQYRGIILTSGITGGGGSSSGITTIENIGAGTGEIFSNTSPSLSGQTSQLRTLLGSGGTNIVTSGNTIIINSDSSGLYELDSPSNIEVGGLPVGSVLTGKTANDILKEILVTTFTPTFVAPNNGFMFSPSQTSTQEVGKTVATIGFQASFDRGDILLQSSFQNPRSGLPNSYNYTGTGLPSSFSTSSLTDPQSISNYVIQLGANTWTNTVSYDQGPQPLDSNNNNFGSPLPSGTTSSKSVTITGIYPWFYGTFDAGPVPIGVNRPDVTVGTTAQDLIDAALATITSNKMVNNSNGTIIANFNSGVQDYIWFAIPATSTDKSSWFSTAFSNGNIGGSVSISGNLFPDFDTVAINSPTGLWSGVNYKFYVSNYQTDTSIPMELRNI